MSSSAASYPPGAEACAETALARRIAAGDRTAEAEWCSRLLPRILVWAKLRARDDVRAADLAQEVIMVVLEKLRANAVDDLERLNGYVAGVCRHTYVGWRRAEHRRAALLEANHRQVEAVASPPEPALDRQRLAHCFDKLTPRARSILALCLFSERTSEEVALELCSSAGAVRVMRHRALADLHRCMEGET